MRRIQPLLAGALLLFAGAVSAQETPRPVRVFLDCASPNCDSREFRTEIGFVEWVTEQAAADVHVLMTSQDAGGGTQYIFDFLGRQALQGVDDRLTHTSSDTDTRVEVLEGLTGVLKAGLVRYMAHQGLARGLTIQGPELGDAVPVSTPERDPWNFWVFRVGADFEASGEDLESSRELRMDVSANRTTAEWKLEFGAQGNFQRERFDLDDRVVHNDTDDWQVAVLAVRSVARHWSAGTEMETSTSTRLNRNFAGRTALALEWNYYPYEQANRRQLVAHLQLGLSRVQYEELTVFDKMEETLADGRFSVAYDVRQPWGNASAVVQFSSYLHDLSKNRLSLNSGLSFRIFRGLELDLEAEYDYVQDQIYLSAEDLDDDDILTGRRALPTDSQYEFSVGLSYRFGSVFNTVVNNRFPWVVRDFQ